VRKKIMIVDDDPEILDMLEMMLEETGYEVEPHGQGQTVLQMQKPYPDLVLLDILLSGMDGRAVCQQLKSQEETRCIPIILLSAHTDAQQIMRDAGANDFLAKPFEMTDLLELIEKYLA